MTNAETTSPGSGAAPGTQPRLPKGRFIKLLQIVHNSRECCSLSLKVETFNLDDAPEFWALSYTWGAPKFGPGRTEPERTPPTLVKCNGQHLLIEQNLFDFLRRARDDGLFVSEDSCGTVSSKEPFVYLRSLPPSGSTATRDVAKGRKVYLWVDAVCINQSDLEERSHQVALMAEIYTRAQSVLVWLGAENPSADIKWTLEEFTPRLLALCNRDWRKDPIFTRGTLDFDGPVLTAKLGEESCARWRAVVCNCPPVWDLCPE